MSGLGVAALLAVILATPALADDWQVVAPEGKGFSVEMPTQPQHRENLNDPELFRDVDDYGSPLGDGYLIATVFDFEPAKRALMNEADVFSLGDAMVPAGCALTASHPLPGGPGAAVESDFACPEGVVLRYRMHLRGDRLWRLAAGGPAGVADGEAADRFFRSFELVE